MTLMPGPRAGIHHIPQLADYRRGREKHSDQPKHENGNASGLALSFDHRLNCLGALVSHEGLVSQTPSGLPPLGRRMLTRPWRGRITQSVPTKGQDSSKRCAHSWVFAIFPLLECNFTGRRNRSKWNVIHLSQPAPSARPTVESASAVHRLKTAL